MLIFIATCAGLLSAVVLATVYLADRYEPEPIEAIQSSFLLGALGQLVVILCVRVVTGSMLWTGPWIVLTVGCAALVLPRHLHALGEADERFDGIVYAVALLAGATLVIHLNNLPQVAATSPYGDVLAQDAAPGLRDLLIMAGWPGVADELGQGLLLIAIAVLMGAVVGVFHMGGWPPGKSALAVAAFGLPLAATELATSSSWWTRAPIVGAAIVVAALVKRRSVFRDHPEAAEPGIMVRAVKTLLLALGTALLVTVILQILSPEEQGPVGSLDSQQLHTQGPEALAP